VASALETLQERAILVYWGLERAQRPEPVTAQQVLLPSTNSPCYLMVLVAPVLRCQPRKPRSQWFAKLIVPQGQATFLSWLTYHSTIERKHLENESDSGEVKKSHGCQLFRYLFEYSSLPRRRKVGDESFMTNTED
jgi:hypothetical protein